MNILKFSPVVLFTFISIELTAQINVINSTNGSLTITPKGIRGKLPNASTVDNENISMGEGALQNNVNAKSNIAIGKYALSTQSFNNSGVAYYSSNIAIGEGALSSNQPTTESNGYGNIAIGYSALNSNTTGTGNISLGIASLAKNTIAHNNIGIGFYSLFANTSGAANLGIGVNALSNNTTGSENVGVGYGALYANNTTKGNTAVGYDALRFSNSSTSGIYSYNTALGNSALYGGSNPANNTGIENTALGAFSHNAYTSGSFNTSIGAYAGQNITSGNRNVMIGYTSGGTSNVSNKLFIANSTTDTPLIKGDFSASELKINGDLKVGGVSDIPQAKLHVSGDYIIQNKVSVTSNQNNLNRNGTSIIKVSGGGPFLITGIDGGIDGMIVHILVTSGTDLTLADDSLSSLTGNKILTGSNADITITQGGGATLYYDGDSAYWRVIGLKQ